MKTRHEFYLQKSLTIALIAVVSTTLAACSSPAPRATASGFTTAPANQQIAELNQRIEELTNQLDEARAEAKAARNLAENAQATADAAQIMAASTDDRIEQMFQKSVFK